MKEVFRVRISQTFQPAQEAQFMELEERFAQMERRRPELPQGRRYRPVSGPQPTNTLIWEADFPTLEEAQRAVRGFTLDEEHERYAAEQRPMMQSIMVEFLQVVCSEDSVNKHRPMAERFC
jgi:uncharacterized protein YcgI (DUF1989 family)